MDDTRGIGPSEVRERLGSALERAERHGARLAVLHVRVGLAEGVDGEALLSQVALRLSRSLRATDAVLPDGADRLVLLLPGVENVGDAATVAEKVLDVLAEPFPVGGRAVWANARIGMALYPDHGFDPDALLRNAEEAMRRTGTEGGPEVRWHAPRSTVPAPDDVAS